MLKYIILIVILIGVLAFLWARYVSTSGLIVKEYPIEVSDESLNGLKIIHFSDLHYKSTIHEKELKKIVNKINMQKPDIVVFTGDLIERGIILNETQQKNFIEILNKIEPKIEVIFVKGNHDYECDYYDELVSELNWIFLNNTYEYVYYNSNNPIVFVGLDSSREGNPDYNNAFSFDKEVGTDNYTILLLHEPDQIDEIENDKWNIALAGHSHLGQVRIPLIGAIWTPPGAKKYLDDYYEFNNSKMFINGGLGTSGLKIRFFNKPSINLYRFIAK